MAGYIGVRCPVCNKKFTQSDDIVVCPVCGAPHHRECYAKNNECIFAADHMSGRVWESPREPGEPAGEQDTKACPRCEASNPADSLFCQVCGTLLGEPGAARSGPEKAPEGFGWPFPGVENLTTPIRMVYGDVSPDDEIDGVPVRDLADYIGPSSAYYLQRFRDMADTGRTITVNFGAFFFNFFYFFYRKMNLWGIVMLLLFLLSMIPMFLYMVEVFPQAVADLQMTGFFEQYGYQLRSIDLVNLDRADHYARLGNITWLINLFIGTIMSLCANRFYYRKCIGDVQRIRAAEKISAGAPGTEGYRRALVHYGGVNRVGVILLVILLFVCYFIVSQLILQLNMGG